MNGKRQGDKLNGVISTGRGKKKTQLSYQSASVSKEPLTVLPLVFHLSGCSAAAHKWKKPIPSRLLYYGFEFLDF